jgi:hypothetical protein
VIAAVTFAKGGSTAANMKPIKNVKKVAKDQAVKVAELSVDMLREVVGGTLNTKEECKK